MSDEDRVAVWTLLGAHHRGDFAGAVEMVRSMSEAEKIGALVSLVSILCAVCEVTVWSRNTSEEIDALLTRMATQ